MALHGNYRKVLCQVRSVLETPVFMLQLFCLTSDVNLSLTLSMFKKNKLIAVCYDVLFTREVNWYSEVTYKQ